MATSALPRHRNSCFHLLVLFSAGDLGLGPCGQHHGARLSDAVPRALHVGHASRHCASRNRSPTSYLHNPAEARAAWETFKESLKERGKYSGDVVPRLEASVLRNVHQDYDMELIKIVDATGEPMGTMNWFAVHTTSMKSSSGLISGSSECHRQASQAVRI